MDIDLFIKLDTRIKEESYVSFLRESCTYKLRSDLNITSDTIECLCIKIPNKHSKNLILYLNYTPPQRYTTLFEKHLQDLLLNGRFAYKSSRFWEQ